MPPQTHIPQTLPMSSTLTAPLPLSTSCRPDDVSLLPNHALPSPTAPLLISSVNNPNTSLPFPPSVTSSPLTPHIPSSNSPSNLPVALNSTSTATTHSGASNLTSPSKWRVSPSQREILQAAFDVNPYPELQKKTLLASELGVTTTQVSKWFQHRRETLTRLGQFKAQYNRTRRTPEQLDILQQAFESDRYPSAERLAQLEAQLDGVTAKQIKLWFKHRRKQALKKRPKSSSASPSVGSGLRSNFEQHRGRGRISKSPQCHPSSQSSYPVPFPTSSLPLENQQQHPLHNLSTQISSDSPSQGQNGHVSSAPLHMQPSHSPDSNSVYPMENNNSNYYAYKQHGMQVSEPLSSGGTTGTTVPSSSTVTPPTSLKSIFSDMELMALRTANVIIDGKPTADTVSRLSRFLGRTQSDVSHWFAAGTDSSGIISDMGMGNNTSNTQYVESPVPVHSEDPGVYSGRHQLQQMRKHDFVPGSGHNQDIHLNRESQEHGHSSNQQVQPVQGMVADFSKHETNASSSNNDTGNLQQHHEKPNFNSRNGNGNAGGEQSKSHIDNGLGESGMTNAKGGVGLTNNEINSTVGGTSRDGSVASKSFHRDDEEQKTHHQHQAQAQSHLAPQNQSAHHISVQPMNQGMVNHRQQQHQISQGFHSQPQQQGMYGSYLCSNEGSVAVGGHPSGVSSNPGGGQGSPMLAPLRYSAGSPVSAGYMPSTNANMWYQSVQGYK